MILLFAKLTPSNSFSQWQLMGQPGTAPLPHLEAGTQTWKPNPPLRKPPSPKNAKYNRPGTKPRPSPAIGVAHPLPLGSAHRLNSRPDAARAVTSADPTLDLLPLLCARTFVLQRRPPGSDSGVFLLCSFCHSGIVPHAAAQPAGAGDSPVHPLLSSLHRPALCSSKTFLNSALSTLS